MEILSSLGDEVVGLMLRFDLLDLSRPERLSREEVLRAVDLAFQMRAANEAASSSGQDNHPAADRSPAQARPLPADRFPAQNRPLQADRSPRERNRRHRDPRVRSRTDGQAGASKKNTKKGDLIGPDERNEILAESEVEDSSGPENEGEPCMVCEGGTGEKRKLACGCFYCAACLRRCIRTGLRNELEFPPRCHQRLTEDDIRWVDRPGLLRLYRQQVIEWDSPAAERVYCSRPVCAAFIPDRREGGEARCGACGAGTCASCRKRWHPGLPCEEDKEDEELMEMMDKYGNGYCTACGTIVESLGGCNHMTCPCGHQFCYLCSATWRNCTCPFTGVTGFRLSIRERAQRYKQGHGNVPMRYSRPRQDDELVGIDYGDQPRIPGNLYVPAHDLNREPVREPARPIPIPGRTPGGIRYEGNREDMIRRFGGTLLESWVLPAPFPAPSPNIPRALPPGPLRPGGPPRSEYEFDTFPVTPPPMSPNPEQQNLGEHTQAAQAPAPQTSAPFPSHHSPSGRRGYHAAADGWYLSQMRPRGAMSYLRSILVRRQEGEDGEGDAL